MRMYSSLDGEILSIVDDILENREFKRLEHFYHHSTSCLQHVMSVARLSYRVARWLRLDCRAAARGGLLHDFFLYDWREHSKASGGSSAHCYSHPYIALNNAEQHFTLGAVERDIITNHMWPMSVDRPRCAESWVVSMADKYMAVCEYAHGALRSVQRMFRLQRQPSTVPQYVGESMISTD